MERQSPSALARHFIGRGLKRGKNCGAPGLTCSFRTPRAACSQAANSRVSHTKNRTHEKPLCEGNGRRRDVGAQLREELCCRIHWRKCTHGDGARFSLSKAYLCALPR